MENIEQHFWHSIPVDQTIANLETRLDRGLELAEVRRRREIFGPNALTPRRSRNPVIHFLRQFHHPLLYILMVAGTVTWVLGEWIDGGVIFAVVLVNAVIGFIQEIRAERAIEALARTMTSEATVLREGVKRRISATELVPGDIVFLEAGDKVPADLRLDGVRDLQVDESTLTGESIPVLKDIAISLPIDTPLADRRNMAYASTLITYGRGVGIVTATGDTSEVGQISRLMTSTEAIQTPLTRKMAHFSQFLLYIVIGLAAATMLVGVVRGQQLLEIFIAAIALAVAAIPEGLPAALTVALAIGVARMARRRAIIRNLSTVETLGSATVICSDKTGTLTENQMTVQQIVAGGMHYEVSGVGYNPSGQVLYQGAPINVTSLVALSECLSAGFQCNDSLVVQEEDRWEVHGDPTEGALVVSALKGGIAVDTLREIHPRIDVIPFESQHQYMATLQDQGDQSRLVYVKGATEVILGKCAWEIGPSGEKDPVNLDRAHEAIEEMAGHGLRVLAFASKELPIETTRLAREDVESGLTLLGLQGMIDPPRPESSRAVQTCISAGLQVKMITGDHATTATVIARQIGLINAEASTSGATAPVLTGRALAGLSDSELSDAAERTNVFARVAPEQKLRLVRALQSRGHVVAMTGDGVNDAPALKQADIGVSMGMAGTEVAKEASDMVLTDDNFATIEAAVEEGRRIFDNLTKIIAWTLPTNLGEGLIILLAVFVGTTLPILPVQILWINMTTVGVLGLVLAFEVKEPDTMTRPPRDPDAPILTIELIGRILLVGTLMLVGAFGLFQWEISSGASEPAARTMAVNVIVLIELFYLFNCRSLTRPLFQVGFFSNFWVFPSVVIMAVLQIMFVYLPVMNTMFHTVPIGLDAWVTVLAVAAVAYLIIEFEKFLRYLFNNRKATRERVNFPAK